ncbi:MAG: AAA domain-containing protein, partial [Candidatus Zophobacter franzmannii]|nr:AAA domain-containing protein [Candidatus Zophobacter franzmannii]
FKRVEAQQSFELQSELLKPGDYLEITGYEQIGALTYGVIERSKVVLEPDFLVDVTQIATAIDRKTPFPPIFILNTLKQFLPNENIFRGSLANAMLDKLIAEPDLGFDELFNQVVEIYPLEVELFHKHISSLKTELEKSHFPTLKNIANRLAKFEVLTEPSYISPKNGLKGRFDLLINDDKLKQQHLLELKGGNAPNYGSWAGHRVQTTCYDMMLKDMSGGERKGKSYILYSKTDPANSLRENRPIQSQEHEVLHLRNEIVALCRDFCSINPFEKVSLSTFADCPSFIQRDVMSISEAYSLLKSHEKGYLHLMVNYVMKEMWASKTGYYLGSKSKGKGFNNLWRCSTDRKLTDYLILTPLKYIELNDGVHTFAVEKELTHRFRDGDSILLYPSNLESGFKGHYLRGNFKSISKGVLSVTVRDDLPERILTQTNYWNCEADSFDSNFFRIMQSLMGFVKASPEKRALLLGELEPSQNSLDIKLDAIPENIKEVISQAYQAKDYFLLQGPPGTGKTSGFIMNYVRLILDQTDQTICLAAFTNRAVDEICHKLKDNGIDFIHISSSLIYKSTTETDTEQKIRVIVSTVHTFHSKGSFVHALYRPDTLIVDEASQLLEQHLIGILAQFKKFILIGDDKQLPAVTTLPTEVGKIEDEELNKLHLHSLKESLFARMFRQAEKNGWQHSRGFLTHHYRMHSEVACLVNHFYDNLLIPAIERQNHPKQAIDKDDKLSQLIQDHRALFLNIQRSGNPYRNRAEAEWACKIALIIHRNSGDEFNENTLGIIVAFRAQISIINELLPEDLRAMVTIDTVERYQGSERDVIIFSPAVNSLYDFNSVQSLDFEGKVDRKLNVAISRAREQFILLGDAKLFGRNEHYKHLLDLIPTHWSANES